ncbi:hypothetical protein LDENG_00270130 [Lucifuga dentata]|nr:hypothetical protein LDENG_00270130 [Lucifuga dentata]
MWIVYIASCLYTAGVLTRTKGREHITLSWLPVHFRIRFKILLITFKAPHGQAPSYISALLTARPLRSADQTLLHVPQSRFKTKGGREFSVIAPTLWNQFPLNIRSVESVQHFKKLVKTCLYKQAFL